MTVQSDPGNDANSYSDAAARAWKTTSGLWKTDANDTVGQNGDSLGNQLWRTTANTWHTRANTAYAGGVWGTGNTWQTNANTAYDSGVWGTGSTWQSRYNSEVTLYNNEVTLYNNQVAATNAKTTTSQSAALSGTWPNSTTSYSANLASLTAPRTGQAHASAVIYVSYTVGTHGQAQILKNGVVQTTASQTGCGSGSGTICFAVQWTGSVTNADTVSVQLASDGGSSLSSGTLDLTVGSV